ncbi:MAG TPA: 30S ribosomal protein S2 [Acidimicrobiales bacterium]|nr:30S ribosomal protein S2 [Acidimicrobiales bacterium]
MAVVTMRQLLEAGVHFGHQTRRWNPKMKRFIFGERNGIYIIDLNQTLQRVDVAYSFVRDLVANGGSVLFIGTKKQSQDPIARSAQQCGMPFVNERWLGGMLTNFQTIALRVKKMQEYERMRATGDFEAMPKKEALILTRELEKLERNLGGIRDMSNLPDAVFIIDIKKEHIAVSEANKMGIPIVAVVDTNCDPDLVQFPIPGNDDAIRSGTLMCHVMAEAVTEGRFVASRRGAVGAGGPGLVNRSFEPVRAEPVASVQAGPELGQSGPGQSALGQAPVGVDIAPSPAVVQPSGLHQGSAPPAAGAPAGVTAPPAPQFAAPPAQVPQPGPAQPGPVQPGAAQAEPSGLATPRVATTGAEEPEAAATGAPAAEPATYAGEASERDRRVEDERSTPGDQEAAGGTSSEATVPTSAAAEVAAAPEH